MIELSGVSHRFRQDAGEIRALDQIDLQVGRGEFVGLLGPSGSGKTTLLLITGGMQRPSEGSVRIDGQDLYAIDPRRRAAFRGRHVGFVFQMFHLVPYLDVAHNVLLAGGVTNGSAERRREAVELLERVGLADRARHRPSELSAGERQRAALARALLPRPPVILADEPTGNLDAENATRVMDLLAEFRDRGGTVLLVTHGPLAARYADRMLRIEAGKLYMSV